MRVKRSNWRLQTAEFANSSVCLRSNFKRESSLKFEEKDFSNASTSLSNFGGHPWFGSHQSEWLSQCKNAENAIILTKKLVSDSSGDISYIHIAVG